MAASHQGAGERGRRRGGRVRSRGQCVFGPIGALVVSNVFLFAFRSATERTIKRHVADSDMTAAVRLGANSHGVGSWYEY